MSFAFLEQEDKHRVTDGDLVPLAQLLLLHGHAIDQCAVETSQIADGETVALRNQEAVPA